MRLGDNFRMRRATPADIETLTRFKALVHGSPGHPGHAIAERARSWLDGSHPIVRPSDWTVIDDLTTGEIVSTCALLSQRWQYGESEFGVGQIEFVGTHPDYRRLGLVRLQIEDLHAESERRGHLLQVIGGIPNYYRQFGYELALSWGGGRIGYACQDIVETPITEGRHHIRPATVDDLPQIAAFDRVGQRRSLLSVQRDDALWRLELDGRGELNVFRRLLFMIETDEGTPVGFFARHPKPHGELLWLSRCELAEGVNWLAVAPVIWQHLSTVDPAIRKIGCWLGTDHPLYRVFPQRLAQVEPAATFYIRIPDPALFVRQIVPVLEDRLARSIAASYSGELRLNFYRSGLILKWEGGRLVDLLPWQKPNVDQADLSFPDLTFYQTLLGHRSFVELAGAFADCLAHNEPARVLVDILWPKAPSQVWSLG
ncbi:GNAT family N-acetyltransferase [bacterium]|nr:GNAT family N-acetyltransferase [bacterium]